MDTWNEYGKWVTKGDNKALAEARRQLIASCKAHGLIIVNEDLPNEVKGNKERPVVAIKDRGVSMTKDCKKVKAYLAQELKDVKAKLKRMKVKDAVSDWYVCKEDAKRLFRMGFTIAEALDSINRKWYGIMSPGDQKAVVLSAAKDMGVRDAIPPKFEESKHKRDKDGKFAPKNGGGAGGSSKSEKVKTKSSNESFESESGLSAKQEKQILSDLDSWAEGEDLDDDQLMDFVSQYSENADFDIDEQQVFEWLQNNKEVAEKRESRYQKRRSTRSKKLTPKQENDIFSALDDFADYIGVSIGELGDDDLDDFISQYEEDSNVNIDKRWLKREIKKEEKAGLKKSDIKSLAKSKNKKEVKKAAKAYWTYFLNGVDDLVDWAGEDEDLRYYAEDGDIDGMAEIMANSKGGRETAVEAIDEMEEDELNDISEHINDSAIKDYKIELMVNGKRIGIVNASSPSEAVNRYEREHPELKNKVDGILVVDAVYKILRDSISYDKAEAERLFGLGYSAREVAMKIKEYQSSGNHSEQMDLIKRLENHRKKFFEEMMAKRRAGRI